MNANFYDIESLANVFTLANYDERRNHVDIYYIVDDPELKSQLFHAFSHVDRQGINDVSRHIYKHNQNFTGTIAYYNLSKEECMVRLCETFGCSDARMINNPKYENTFKHEVDGVDTFRLICDTDPIYKENPDLYPYLLGYNSFNYDTTMLALLFNEAWSVYQQNENTQIGKYIEEKQMVGFNAVTAKKMREHNDILFRSYKNNMPSYLSSGPNKYQSLQNLIRKNMLLSGRHLDVARLNEKQQKVALKRLLGMLGYQIMESDKLKPDQAEIKTIDELLDLLAYNVSDIVNLRMLFYHKTYQAQFELKRGLLQTYPELIYAEDGDTYKPCISVTTVRFDRLNIDASSAQFATKCLCPYGHLTDIETVSFLYPHKEKAKELGIKQVNVLDETKKFFDNLYPGPEHAEIRARFQKVYDYYKRIEGQNFNDSKTYFEDFGSPIKGLNFPPKNLKDIPKVTDGEGTFMPYYDANGKPTSCYVIFSTGGVHGAEYNKALFDQDVIDFEKAKRLLDEVKQKYPDPVAFRKLKKVTLSDGNEYKCTTFLQSGRKVADSAYKDTLMAKPVLAGINTKGMTELNKRYTYTSSDAANHEDFTSYYPNLLRMMMAFFNKGLGYDRYAEIFQQKEDFGKLMKDKSLSAEEREHYRILREGTKLILNSASGAADALFENNIRVNNQIISMRIIGQLFSWRIGQAQAAQGSKVISTNTDGLYSVMEEKLNNAILAKESADIGVAIEPEPMFLISKDTNNRIELTGVNGKIIGASGGTLGCRMGPNPTKALAHPAILDWALAEYLTVAASGYKGLSLDQDFNDDIGRSILMRSKQAFKPLDFMLMYQNIVSSSPSSITYVYGVTDTNPNDAIVLQHYNRMFIMKDNTPDTLHLWAACAKKVTPAALQKRKRNGERNVYETVAMNVLTTNGVDVDSIKANNNEIRDIVPKKVTNIEPEWYVKIINSDLHAISDAEFQTLVNNLDYEKYLDKLRESYENSWRNHVPATIAA